ncbi:MAG: globin [Pseudomonadales bacterium]|nr:globin [Pseudomonadales bacterium]
MTDLVLESLELAAENIDDIVPPVYKSYFDRCPGSEALMSHIDNLVRGKMLDEVLRLVMKESYEGEQQYLDFEVNNHKLAYSVEPHMYGNLLAALRDVIRDAAGDGWTDAHEQAWDDRIALLTSEITART